MIVKLHGLRRRGKVEILAEKNPSDYDLPETDFRRPIYIALQLEDTGELIDAFLRLRSFRQAVCDRCLKEFELPLVIDLSLKLIPEEHQKWTSDDEAMFFHPDNPEVDLTEIIRDHLMLSAPMKILCRDDCQGLCSGCGANLNSEKCTCVHAPADERWSALAKLKEKMLAEEQTQKTES